MKLSKPQQEVLNKMNEGWQLGLSLGWRTHYWLQKGGCGRGGPSQDVHANTAHALRRAKLIVVDKTSYPLQTYRLSHGNGATTASPLSPSPSL